MYFSFSFLFEIKKTYKNVRIDQRAFCFVKFVYKMSPNGVYQMFRYGNSI